MGNQNASIDMLASEANNELILGIYIIHIKNEDLRVKWRRTWILGELISDMKKYHS